jgi:hypothetical protein
MAFLLAALLPGKVNQKVGDCKWIDPPGYSPRFPHFCRTGTVSPLRFLLLPLPIRRDGFPYRVFWRSDPRLAA